MDWVPGAPVDALRAPSHAYPTTDETAAIVGPTQTHRRRVGDTELPVFPVALSGNVFGWTADAATTTPILDGYHDRGGNFVDTADSYAAGRSETMIGSWMPG